MRLGCRCRDDDWPHDAAAIDDDGPAHAAAGGPGEAALGGAYGERCHRSTFAKAIEGAVDAEMDK